MNTRFKIGFLFCFLFAAASLFSQEEAIRILTVKGTITQQIDNVIKELPTTKFQVEAIDEALETDKQGAFSFQFPLIEDRLYKGTDEINFTIPGYTILRPFNGVLQIDTLDYDLVLDILVIKKDAVSAYSKQVKKLNRRLSKLKRENVLSTARLNVMNDSLLANIQQSETQKAVLQTTIADLETNLASTSADNEALNQKLISAKTQLMDMQSSVEELNEALQEALEDKYRRQQEFYESISKGLQDYLVRTKDVHELLVDVGNYFPSSNNPEFVGAYNVALNAYNDIFVILNEEQDNYVQGVKQYWEDPQVAKQVAQTFEVVFDLIHYPRLQPAFREINGFITTRKKKKAISSGQTAFNELSAPLINLEKMIGRTILVLDEVE